MTTDQLTGPLRALAPIIIALLVSWGLDSTTAGFLAAAVIALLSAAWSWWSNRPVKMAADVSEITGVKVVVGPNAPEPLKKLAGDPAMPGIVPS